MNAFAVFLLYAACAASRPRTSRTHTDAVANKEVSEHMAVEQAQELAATEGRNRVKTAVLGPDFPADSENKRTQGIRYTNSFVTVLELQLR